MKELYMVMYVADQEERLVFRGVYHLPAIYEDRDEAVKEMNSMSALYPDTVYFVQHFVPVPATPRPLL